MSKNENKPAKLELNPYEKFLFLLVQYNPFLAIYFRRHRPSDGFIYSILNAPNNHDGSQQVKTILFDQIRKETTDLDKIAMLTKMIFGKHKVPGLVEDYLPEDWAEKQYNFKDFVLVNYTNQITPKNLEKIYKKIESSFDRWFFCTIYFPHAQRLQLTNHVKFIEELPEKQSWKLLAEECSKLVNIALIHSPYPKEHVTRVWADNIIVD